MGTAAVGLVHPMRAAAAAAVALALQVGVNFANDYFDARGGVDTASRTGPVRATAAGLVSPGSMRTAALVSLAFAGLCGMWLASRAGWELLWIGGAAIIAALGYSGGPRPYASAGLGELSVFIFFGLAATIGSAYVQTESFSDVAASAAVPIGSLAVALLVVNNLRDIKTDAAAGKRTLAVRTGERCTKALYVTLLGLSFLSVLSIAWFARSAWPLIGLLAVPLAVGPIRDVMAERDTARLIRALHGTARTELAFGALVTIGLWMARSGQ